LTKKIANQSSEGFSGNTQDNPKIESCKVIELRSENVLTPLVPKVTKKNEDVVVVEEAEQGVVEKIENGVVENEKKEKNSEGEKNNYQYKQAYTVVSFFAAKYLFL